MILVLLKLIKSTNFQTLSNKQKDSVNGKNVLDAHALEINVRQMLV